MRFTISSLVALAVATEGIHVTSPADGQCVDLTKDLPVQWISVNTDRNKISFSLVNYKGATPPVDMPLNFIVETSSKSFDLPGRTRDVARNLSAMNNGAGYQINIIPPNSPPGTTPLAQSGTFQILTPGEISCS